MGVLPPPRRRLIAPVRLRRETLPLARTNTRYRGVGRPQLALLPVSRVKRSAQSFHSHNVSPMKTALAITAPPFRCRYALTIATTSDALAAPPTARTIVSDLGSLDQDSSPRMALVAKDDMSRAGGVTTGLMANQAPMGRYIHHRLVHSGTSSSGVLKSLDQALNG